MGPTLTTDAIVLQRHPPSDSFQRLALFSPTEGNLSALQRVVARKSAGSEAAPADLFDELQLRLEQGRQGGSGGLWFVKESRLVTRHAGIGRSYDALRLACDFATVIVRNPVPAESIATVHELLRLALSAFAGGVRPDVVAFKSLYCLVRDEGYPLKQDWLPTLPAADRATVAGLLAKPLGEQTALAADTARLHRRLLDYLRANTELHLG